MLNQMNKEPQPDKKSSKKSVALRRSRNIGLTIVALLLVLVIGGVAYTYLAGPSGELAVEETEDEPTDFQQLDKPREPAFDAPVGVSQQALTSPVAPGSNASLTVRTLKDAQCTITVKYGDDLTSEDSGLTPKVADAYGTVGWAWTVESSVPEGEWPVEVECVRNDKSGALVVDLVVKQP